MRQEDVLAGNKDETIDRKIVGSGCLDTLSKYHFFDALYPKKVLPKKNGLRKIAQCLEKLLDSGSPDQKYLIEVYVWSRLFRPRGYNKKDKRTWDYTNDDHDLFRRFIRRWFESESERFIFRAMHDEEPERCHGRLSKLGQKKGRGGRPRAQETPVQKSPKKRIPQEIKDAALQRARVESWTSTQLVAHLCEVYKMELGDRQARRWLEKDGINQPPHRPASTAKQEADIAIHVDSSEPAQTLENKESEPCKIKTIRPSITVCILHPLASTIRWDFVRLTITRVNYGVSFFVTQLFCYRIRAP